MSENTRNCGYGSSKIEIVVSDLRQRSKKVVTQGNYIVILDKNGDKKTFVYPLNESEEVKTETLVNYLNLGNSLKVGTMIAVVDKYGDVLYYEIGMINLKKG